MIIFIISNKANDNQLSEDWSTANSVNVVYIKRTSDN